MKTLKYWNTDFIQTLPKKVFTKRRRKTPWKHRNTDSREFPEYPEILPMLVYHITFRFLMSSLFITVYILPSDILTSGHLHWETFGRICIMVTAVTARVKDHENNEILTKCTIFWNTVSFFSFITEWWQILKGRKAEGKEAWRAEDFWQNLKYSLFLVQGSCCS